MAIANTSKGWPNLNEVVRKHVSKHIGMDTEKKVQKYQVHDDEVYERRIVHKFTMGDVDDVEVYIASPIYEWQQTEHGQWVMKNGKDPQYHINADPVTFGYQVLITAHITPKRWTEYILRGWFAG